MRKVTSFEKRRNRAGYIFLSPWIFATVFLLIYPVIYSLVLSFAKLENVANVFDLTFIGIENFKEAFVIDDRFLGYLITAITDMLINTPMILVFSLLVAILINRDIKGRAVFRLVFFLPVLLGAGYVMRELLGQDVQSGSMEIARGMLLPPNVQSYIGETVTGYVNEFFNRITLVMWKSGVQIVLALSGLQGISPSLFEASRIDGAGEWETFWKITLPMITPILLLNAVYTIISFAFENSNLLSYIINKAFSDNKFEYAAAIGWIYFLVVLVLLGIVFCILNPFIKRIHGNS